MPITDWPINERPREKLLQHGSKALSDAELLAIFLRTGVQGKSAVDLARDMLQEYGSLRQLMSADRHRFCQSQGLGDAKYAQLQAVLEMAKRHMFETLQRGEVLSSPLETRLYFTARLRDYAQEVFACLFLDNKHRVISCEDMFRGTIDSTSVHPREVVRRSLELNAAALIVAHNHPSGVAEPSQADRLITRRLRDALALIDVRLLDHLIVGDGYTVSLAERGCL